MATETQSSLVASGNTYNPSLIVLRVKGYELWLERGAEGSLWRARKGGQKFLAYSGPGKTVGRAHPTWVRQSFPDRTLSAEIFPPECPLSREAILGGGVPPE